jgi:hypothetical protein
MAAFNARLKQSASFMSGTQRFYRRVVARQINIRVSADVYDVLETVRYLRDLRGMKELLDGPGEFRVGRLGGCERATGPRSSAREPGRGVATTERSHAVGRRITTLRETPFARVPPSMVVAQFLNSFARTQRCPSRHSQAWRSRSSRSAMRCAGPSRELRGPLANLLGSGVRSYLDGAATNGQRAIPVRPVSEGRRSDHSP